MGWYRSFLEVLCNFFHNPFANVKGSYFNDDAGSILLSLPSSVNLFATLFVEAGM